MTLQDFINAHNGQYLSVDGADANECTAVAHAWEQNLGLGLVLGNAIDTYANADPSVYDKTVNSPSAVPKPGAIMVWGPSSAPDTGTSAVGHTAVFVSGDANSFTSFDQNFPTGSVCHEVHHSYNGVIGWFYPKVLDAPTNQGNNDMPTIEDLTRARIISYGVLGRNGYDGSGNALDGDADADLNANHVGQDLAGDIWNQYQSAEGQDWITKRLPAVYAKAAQVDGLQKQIDGLNSIVSGDQDKINELNATIATLKEVKPVVEPVTPIATPVVPAQKTPAPTLSPVATPSSQSWLERLIKSIFG